MINWPLGSVGLSAVSSSAGSSAFSSSAGASVSVPVSAGSSSVFLPHANAKADSTIDSTNKNTNVFLSFINIPP